MSCPFRDDVCLLADRELPFARRMVVEAHLAVCAECARADDVIDRAETALRDGDPAPLGVVDPLLRRFAALR